MKKVISKDNGKTGILSSDVPVDYFLKKAMEAELEGNLVKSIDYINRALNKIQGIVLYIRKAMCLEMMELYEVANNIYFEMLDLYGDVPQCYYALAENLAIEGDDEASNYAKEKFARKADGKTTALLTEMVGSIEEEAFMPDLKVVPTWATKKSSGISLVAKTVLGAGEYETALQLFSMVEPDNEDYIVCQNGVATSFIGVEKYEDALNTAFNVLKIEENNIVAICNVIESAHKLKQFELRDAFIEKLTKLDNGTSEYYCKVCLVYALCNIDEKVLECTEKVLNILEYDLLFTIFKGIAEYNLQNFESAQKTFKQICVVYDPFNIAKFYLELTSLQINSLKSQNVTNGFCTLEYLNQVPLFEMRRRCQILIDAKRDYSLRELTKMLECDDDFRDCVLWTMSLESGDCDEEILQFASYLMSSKDKKVAEVFKKYLLSTAVDPDAKSKIMKSLITNYKYDKINYVSANMFRTLKPKYNFVNTPPQFLDSYALVMSEMCFITTGFEKAVFQATQDVAIRIMLVDNFEFDSIEAIAVVICYVSNVSEIMDSLKALCGIFGASYNTVMKYLKKLKITVKEEKINEID